jgi:nitrogen fixation NifU-like protein
MNDLRELYQEVILDHNRKPRNFRAVAGANRTAEGHNPLCGDHIALALRVEDGMVRDAWESVVKQNRWAKDGMVEKK